jgi:hypothetical protein
MIKHSGAAVMGAYLLTQGIFSDPQFNRPWPLFINSLPDQPNQVAVVYTVPGMIDGREMRAGTIEHPGFQVMLRAAKNVSIDAQGVQLNAALDAIDNEIIHLGDTTYLLLAMKRTTPLIPIGEEVGGGRLLFTLNGTLTYKEFGT